MSSSVCIVVKCYSLFISGAFLSVLSVVFVCDHFFFFTATFGQLLHNQCLDNWLVFYLSGVNWMAEIRAGM